MGGNHSNFSRVFANWLTSQHVANFRWVLFNHLPLRNLAMKQQTAFTEGGQIWRSYFKPFADQSITRHFEKLHRSLCSFQRPCPIGLSRFIPKIFAINSRSHRKTTRSISLHVFGLRLFGTVNQLFMADC